MHTLTTEIEIAAAPAEVRQAFLDFDSYPTWSTAFIKSIEVTSGDKGAVKPGDKLKITLNGVSFPATVKANSPEEFKWLGSLIGVFSGEHAFHFRPSSNTPGHTTLVQEEEFSGLLSFLVGPTWSQGKKTKAGFEAFNCDLKARVEGPGPE